MLVRITTEKILSSMLYTVLAILFYMLYGYFYAICCIGTFMLYIHAVGFVRHDQQFYLYGYESKTKMKIAAIGLLQPSVERQRFEYL